MAVVPVTPNSRSPPSNGKPLSEASAHAISTASLSSAFPSPTAPKSIGLTHLQAEASDGSLGRENALPAFNPAAANAAVGAVASMAVALRKVLRCGLISKTCLDPRYRSAVCGLQPVQAVPFIADPTLGRCGACCSTCCYNLFQECASFGISEGTAALRSLRQRHE